MTDGQPALRLGIVDYGVGNIASVIRLFTRLGVSCVPVRSAETLSAVDALVLPGVGAFASASRHLRSSGLTGALNRAAIDDGVPVLGICLGMQLMSTASEEGEHNGQSMPGLGWIQGSCRRILSGAQASLRLPHVGWDEVVPAGSSPMFPEGRSEAYYFSHSFVLEGATECDVTSRCHYGEEFPGSIQRKNLFGTQFHPELSGKAGVDVALRFIAYAKATKRSRDR